MSNLTNICNYIKYAIEKDKTFRTLYHIRNVGGAPKPNPLSRYKEFNTQRHWLGNINELNGIFLTSNPYAIAFHHGFDVENNKVYIVKITENIIKQSGGLHRYESGTNGLPD